MGRGPSCYLVLLIVVHLSKRKNVFMADPACYPPPGALLGRSQLKVERICCASPALLLIPQSVTQESSSERKPAKYTWVYHHNNKIHDDVIILI